jgi:hypothetical protein
MNFIRKSEKYFFISATAFYSVLLFRRGVYPHLNLRRDRGGRRPAPPGKPFHTHFVEARRVLSLFETEIRIAKSLFKKRFHNKYHPPRHRIFTAGTARRERPFRF